MTLWTVAHQPPLVHGFVRQYWSGLPFPAPGDLPDPGIKTASVMALALHTYSLPNELPVKTMSAKSLQLCLNICNPMDYRLPGSSVLRILQVSVLEWVAQTVLNYSLNIVKIYFLSTMIDREIYH